MNKDQDVFIEHILQSVELIEEYTNNMTKEDFINSDFLHDTVIQRIKIIEEVVKTLSEDFKNKYHEISWQDIVYMSNLIKNPEIDLELTWEFIKNDIPALKRQISKIGEDLN